MKQTFVRSLLPAILMLALAVPTFAPVPTLAATPQPKATMSTVQLPNEKLHTEFVVEVNAKGQVVLVKSGKSSPYGFFNSQTYGNVLQMWIRHPDGTAEVGTYRVTYDYDPKTKNIKRGVALIKAGGNWGNKEGAATEMIDIAKRENAKAAAAAKASAAKAKAKAAKAKATPAKH